MSALTQSRIYIYTSYYPYSGGKDRSFVEPQLPYLASFFETIILVPYYTSGKLYKLPEAVACDTTFAAIREKRFLSILAWLEVLADRGVYREIWNHPALFSKIVKYALIANATAMWVQRINAPSICYTMSMDAITMGLAKGRDRGAPIKVVSRCIGGDVYETQNASRYIPFKQSVISMADRLYPCSQVMTDSIQAQFSELQQKIETSRMGVPNPEFIAQPSCDGVRRVVSCGAVIELKRYDMLAEAMKLIAIRNPANQFQWRHIPIGDVSGLKTKLSQCEGINNLEVIIEGESASVMDIYRNNPVDLFVHTSKSEGLPFVIMEALSCGLPVIATDAGGVGELVDSQVGKLLSVDISPDELAEQLWKLLECPGYLEQKKSSAVQRWESTVNAETNYAQFASDLAAL